MEDLILPEEDDPYEPHPLRNALLACTLTMAFGAALFFAPLVASFFAGCAVAWFFSDQLKEAKWPSRFHL